MYARIVNGYDKMNDAKLIGETNGIITALTANFATAPGLPNLISARDQATVAMALAADGSKYNKAQRDERRSELIAQLHVMAAYVSYITNLNAELIAGSGFKLAKAGTPKPAPTAATDLQLANGNSGELLFSFKPVPGATGYTYEITADPITPDAEWVAYSGTRSSFLFSGLEPGKRYWVRVTAIGPNGAPATSEPVSRIVI